MFLLWAKVYCFCGFTKLLLKNTRQILNLTRILVYLFHQFSHPNPIFRLYFQKIQATTEGGQIR